MPETRDRDLERATSFTGQKSGLPPKTLQPSDCETVTNFLTKRGTLKRVNGDETYGFVPGTGRILWLERLRNKWAIQRENEIYVESGEDAGTFSSIDSSLDPSTIISDIYRGEVYLVNGTDQKVIKNDLSATRLLGLQSPISAANLSASDYTVAGSGGTFDAKNYKATITLYDPATNVESPALNVRPNIDGICTDLGSFGFWTVDMSGASSNSFTIHQSFIDALYANTFNGSVLIDTARATKIRVYTSGATDGVSASVFRLSLEVAKPSSSGIVVTAPGAGILFPTNNIPPPSKLRQQEAYAYISNGSSFINTYSVPATVGSKVYTSARFFRDSLLAIGPRGLFFPDTSTTATQSYDSILYIHEPFQPDYIFDTREIGQGDQQYPTGVATLRDSVALVFKERSIYYISGTSADTYVVRVMDIRRGAVSASTIQETPYGIFALDRTGVIQVAAIGPSQLVSKDIEDVIRTINFAAISTAYSGYDSEENRYWLAVPTDLASAPNKTLVYKADEGTWSIVHGQEGSAMRFGVASDGTSRSLIGSSTNGRLARIDKETNVTFGGGQIISEYLSGPFYGGDPTRKKKAKFVYITAESNTDWTFDLEVVPDFGQEQAFVRNGLNSLSLYSVYAASLVDNGANVGVFDSSYWASGKTRKQLKIPVSCVGYGFQIRIRNSSTNTNQYGFRILSIEIECAIMGK